MKELLSSLGAKYVAIELDQRSDGSEIQQELGNRTGGTSVPRVFIKEEFIGGCDGKLSSRQCCETLFLFLRVETFALHNKGGLVPKLKEAGAL